MPPPPHHPSSRPLVFSDLDGTFLDSAYQPALDAPERADAFARHDVVWVSSRTADELLHLQQTLSHEGDAVGENGGVLVTRDTALASAAGPASQEAPAGVFIVRLAAPVTETRSVVQRTFAARHAPLRTLDELSLDELAQRSAYTVDDAARAAKRRTSVMLVDADTRDPRVAAAIDDLRRAGMSASFGGRWISIVHGADKGSAVRSVIAARTQRDGRPPPVIAAIGDADNDEPMLRAVPLPFVVRRGEDGYAPALARIPGARLLQRDGTAGWAEMLSQLDALAGEPR